MRLSQAIALGRTLCSPVPATQDDLNGGGCALGMGARALGLKFFHGYSLNEINYPTLRNRVEMPCSCDLPRGDYWYGTLGGAIAHFFNEHVFGAKDWTLDQLIDWVRSVEPAEETPRPTDALAKEPVSAEELSKRV
jgi:hypothetical protein